MEETEREPSRYIQFVYQLQISGYILKMFILGTEEIQRKVDIYNFGEK